MLKRVVSALTLCFMSLPVWAQTEASVAAPEAVEEAPQTVLVSGSRPGPGLWKISKDDHVMWVFGSYDPLPTKMEWRSRDIEKVIAASQQYLKPPASSLDVGFLGGMGALPFLIGIKKNPDGDLKTVLPPEVYARWQPMKQKYFADDDSIERERPIFVADQLASRAKKAAGLDGGREIGKTINKLVEKHKLKVVDASYHIELKEPGKAARDFKKSAMNDAACLAKTIERLESELDVMRSRANAWAVGELDEIRKLNYGGPDACFEGLSTSSLAKNQPELLTIMDKAAASWVSAAEKAIAANPSTFAVVQIKDILNPKGVIATLQAKGYTVEPPK
jgi:hypothetical protein